MNLNQFHAANAKRAKTDFHPEHSPKTLCLCIQEETGELAAAYLGVTGEKARKNHLTVLDVLDAVADCMTYLSLLATQLGIDDLEYPPIGYYLGATTPAFITTFYEGVMHSGTPTINYILLLQTQVGFISDHIRQGHVPAARRAVENAFAKLAAIAYRHECTDIPTLLGQTFNMVSDRVGSNIKVEL